MKKSVLTIVVILALVGNTVGAALFSAGKEGVSTIAKMAESVTNEVQDAEQKEIELAGAEKSAEEDSIEKGYMMYNPEMSEHLAVMATEQDTFELIQPTSADGYYLNTGVMTGIPDRTWSGGNVETGVISGAWTSTTDRFAYDSEMKGLLLTKWQENTLTTPLTESGD